MGDRDDGRDSGRQYGQERSGHLLSPQSQHSARSSSAKVQLWPSGADGSGWPCPTFTRIPVGRPKILSCSYVPATGAASPGACSGRCAVMQPRRSCRHRWRGTLVVGCTVEQGRPFLPSVTTPDDDGEIAHARLMVVRQQPDYLVSSITCPLVHAFFPSQRCPKHLPQVTEGGRECFAVAKDSALS
jgi:hypothetical protein